MHRAVCTARPEHQRVPRDKRGRGLTPPDLKHTGLHVTGVFDSPAFIAAFHLHTFLPSSDADVLSGVHPHGVNRN